MNSRIEVPLALPPPHFDDDATIATARQVEPIGRARSSVGLRKLRTIVPLLLAAMLCGALGAATVNYYDRRQQTELPQKDETPVLDPALQTKTEPSTLPITTSESNDAKPRDEGRALESKETVVRAERTRETDTEAKQIRRNERTPEPKPQKTSKRAIDSEAAKLTRQRRVRPANHPASSADRNGAARITDIFGGPNP